MDLFRGCTRMSLVAGALGAAGHALAAAPPADGVALAFTPELGYERSEGDYGSGVSVATDQAIARFVLDIGDFSLNAAVPYLRFTVPADGTIVIGGRPIRSERVQQIVARRRVQQPPGVEISGAGDVSLGAGYAHTFGEGPWSLDGGAGVKLANGSEVSGLGTGTTEPSAYLGLTFARGDWSVRGEASYTRRENTETVAWRNGAAGLLGVTWKPDDAWELRANGFIGQSEIEGDTAVRSAGLSLVLHPTKRSSIAASFTRGLSDGAADTVAGVSLSYRFE